MERISRKGTKALRGGCMNSNTIPSELTIDRYLIGDASEAEVRKVKKWIEADPDAEVFLSRKAQQAHALMEAIPSFDALAGKVARRHDAHPRVTGKLSLFIVAGSGAALIFSAAVVMIFMRQPDDNWTAKGSDGKSFCMLKHDSSLLRVEEKAVCRTGDTVQFYHTSDHTPWVMLLYAENGGKYTSFLPADTALQMQLSSTPVPLPFSIVIDTTTGTLDLALVVSSEPFSAEDAIKVTGGKTGGRLQIRRLVLVRE